MKLMSKKIHKLKRLLLVNNLFFMKSHLIMASFALFNDTAGFAFFL